VIYLNYGSYEATPEMGKLLLELYVTVYVKVPHPSLFNLNSWNTIYLFPELI